MRFDFRHVPVLICLSALLAAAACGFGPTDSRIMLLGFDGADPNAVDLLMAEGKLPNFARLRQNGAYGRLRSMKPLLSPVVWTTIATGRTPDQHRIGHFVATNPNTGEQLPVTSQMRKTRAIWNILSDAGRTVSIVGWWATWPAETVNGSVVSDHLCYHFLFEEGFSGAGEAAGVTYPPELADRLQPLIRRPSDLTANDTDPFVHVSPAELDRPFEFTDDLSHFKWALATAETYRAIGLDLWERDRPDFLATYIEATDSTSHLFGHLFRSTGLSGELAEQQRRYGGTVEAMYVRADAILGEFMDAMDDRTTLIVVSDHGFRLGALQDDPSRTRDMRRVSERFHEEDGIIYMYGNGVKRYARIEGATILDVTPTLLALAGVPAARDMTGRVLTEALDVEPLERIPSYETDSVESERATADSAVDPAILERLRSLGYLDTTSPTGDRNVAAILFEQGKFEEAVVAYRKVVSENPDDSAAHASLAGTLGAMGNYDEALEHLEAAIRLEPLNPESYHNRAVIHEKRGEMEAAADSYRTALRYNPDYKPSREALIRLTGSASMPSDPGSDSEKLAWTLAQRASEAARRGDYDTAMSKLDEAERIAPRYALVYQYRSNVAYLMGNRDAAIAALEKALEIEPDNALYSKNLETLRSSGPGE